MEFEIRPFLGAGPILLGMTRVEVLQLSLGRVEQFRRDPSQLFASDHFVDLGVVVAYKAPQIVEAIELAPPSSPVFCGVRLFDETVEHVQSLLQSKDFDLDVDCDGFTSKALGIGGYMLGSDENDEDDDPPRILSIIVFERGYYDDERMNG